MLRPHLLRALVLAALLTPMAMSAQAGPVRAPSACTYDTCAVRVEPAFFSAPKLLRGRAGEEIGRLGGFGGGVDSLLAGPDSAAAYARRYVTNTKRSAILGLLGTVAFVVALARDDHLADADPTTATIALTGTAFAVASIPFSLRASRSLSRAVWWYNSALPTR